MYECMSCGIKFCEEDASVKSIRIRIHGEDEEEDIDVCPHCHSEDIVYVEDDDGGDLDE